MTLKSTYLFMALTLSSMVCAAQQDNPYRLENGLETSRTCYTTQWICIGDTLAVDSSDHYGIIHLIDGFWITSMEIPQDLWTYYMNSNPSRWKGGQLPVTGMTRSEIDTFCSKITEASRQKWRLPSKEEWLFAFKGGLHSEGYTFSGSNKHQFVGWFADNSGGLPHETELLIRNELYLYDMSGNVAEMVTSGDTIEWMGGCYLDQIPKKKGKTIVYIQPPPEAQGFRPVAHEPIWFDQYQNRVYR